MQIAHRIKNLLLDKHIKIAALERDAGLEKDTVRNILRGMTREPSVSTVYAIADALGMTIEEVIGCPPLAAERTLGKHKFLPVLYRTGGGVWIEADEYSDLPIGQMEYGPSPFYVHHKQWFERLEGDSMNRLVPDGAFLQVVDAVSLEYRPTDGDIVIVERTRDAGFLRERSAKQIEIKDDVVELWPRSTNERWQKPIIINEHPDDETVTVQIVGLVINAVIRIPVSERWARL